MASFFSQFAHIHMVGIKGAGMTALAELLHKNGGKITGSDTEERFYTDEILTRLGIPYQERFASDHIEDTVDLVIYSTAYQKEENEELKRAAVKGIPCLSYPEAVGKLTEEKLTIAVAGTHGKTTTSSLLAEMLRCLESDPSAIIGSKISQWGGSALTGEGKFFVLEADEYQDKLSFYQPFAVLLTSVDYDHPDFFPDHESYLSVFKKFVARIPPHGILIYNGDDAYAAQIAKSARSRTLSYGFLPHNDFQIKDYSPVPPSQYGKPGVIQSFELWHQEENLGPFELSLPGRHNASNAGAVLAFLSFAGFSLQSAKKFLPGFLGTARRFEYLGERFGALIYDDYAHHPEELKATLRAFRELYPQKRLIGIFHPHTFTRTKALFQEFAQSFDDLDQVILLPIYGSAREVEGGVASEDLAVAINTYSPGKAEAKIDYEEVVKSLEKEIGKNDVVVSLGAGDVWRITHALARKEIAREKV